MATRRERFRAALARLTPAGNPSEAIERGYYISRPGRSAVSVISARLELVPTSSFLLIGGIGSGKTTELLMMAKTLNALDDIHAFYIDVSAIHDIKNMPAGTLSVVAAVELAKYVVKFPMDSDAERAREELLDIARGYRRYHKEVDAGAGFNDEPPDNSVYVPGAIKPPDTDARPLTTKVDERSQLLRRMCAPLRRIRPHIVLVFDSLDRKANLKEFKEIILEDVEALHRIGIGVILTVPLAMIHGESRIMVQQYFQDRTFLQAAVDVKNDASGVDFLTKIIHARAEMDMIPNDAAKALARASGGVLRDMIALAHSALQEAYSDGADHVEVKHVDRASKAFGRQLLVGLDADDHAALEALYERNYFAGVNSTELYLLATQRIIVYSATDGEFLYAMHPTLEDVLYPSPPF